MKYSVILDILIELLSKRQLTASYLAEKYDLSPRTIYRYVEIVANAVPLQIKRGRNGGICLSDSYLLPAGFFTKEEYDTVIEALSEAYARQPERKFLKAREKLCSQEKQDCKERVLRGNVEDFLLHENALLLPSSAVDKLRIMGAGMRSLTIVDVEYVEGKKRVSRKIEPHLLLLQNDEWHVYAFCHLEREFRLFALSRLYSVIQTEENFKRRPFEPSDVPLSLGAERLPVRLEIYEEGLESVRAWLGVENLQKKNGKWIADVRLPNDERVLQKILSLGGCVKVLSPAELKEKLQLELEKISRIYE